MSPAAAMTGSSVADATDVSDASEANEATTAIVSEKPTNGKRYFKVNSSAVKNASNAANARQKSYRQRWDKLPLLCPDSEETAICSKHHITHSSH